MASQPRHHEVDSGYSWVVLLAVFVVAFFHLGIVKVFGVFVPELVEQLGLSMWTIGISCSVGISLNALLGPLWTATTRVASYRTLTIFGGLVSSLGVICLSFSNTGAHLALAMALISLGAGLPLVAKVVALKDYFQQKFSMANGIAFTGGSLGFAVFAPLMEHLIDKFGWRGALIIYAAMNLNVCIAGVLMRPPVHCVGKRFLSSASKQLSKNLEPLPNNTARLTNSSEPLTKSTNTKNNTLQNSSNTTQPLSSGLPHLSNTTELSSNSKQPLPKEPTPLSKLSTFLSKKSNPSSSHGNDKPKSESTCSKLVDYFGFSVLTHYPILLVYFFAMGLHEFVSGGWMVFLIPYSVSLGFTPKVSSFLTTLGAIGALLGRLLVGPFVDGGLISGRMMFCCLATSGAMVMFIYPFTSAYGTLSVVSFLTGCFLASTTPIFVVMLKDILTEDGDGFAGAVGLLYMARGFGTLLGGPITGWLYDTTGSFHLSFLILAIFEASAAVMTLIQPSCLPQVQGYKILRQA